MNKVARGFRSTNALARPFHPASSRPARAARYARPPVRLYATDSVKRPPKDEAPILNVNIRFSWVLGTVALFAAAGYYQWIRNGSSTVDEISARSTAPLDGTPPPRYNLTKENIEAAQKEFIALLRADGVDDRLGNRIARSSTEWSPAPRGDLDRPCVIVYPKTTEDVSNIAKICHRRRIPMIAFSGGTSLEGTLAAIHGEVCVDFSRMNKILALHERDMDVVVQPGVGYVELNEFLAKENLFFPPDPGPGAQIGGMISQGCSGPNAYRYGTIKDWVLGLTVVLADGTVIKTRHRPKKSSAGFNLTQLMVSSEGLLGFISEASLKVTSTPENVRVATATFPSTQAAVDVAVKIAQIGLPVAAIELLDEISIRAVNQSGYCDRTYKEGPTLFMRFSGTKDSVKEHVQQVLSFSKASRCLSFDLAATDAEADALWQARKTVLWSLMGLKNDPSDSFYSPDLCVPISRLADVIDATNAKIKESGLTGGCMGHVGDGNIHVPIFYNKEQKEKARRLVDEIQRMGIEMEGTISGEHGIGMEHRDMLVEELGEDSIDAMRKIKLALDPLCLMNPDKMIRMVRKKAT